MLFFKYVSGITALGRKPLIIDIINKTHSTMLGLQESKKESFTDSYLKSLIGNRDFAWNHLPSTSFRWWHPGGGGLRCISNYFLVHLRFFLNMLQC